MGEAKVTSTLTDLTNRVLALQGIYGGIVLPAKKGKVGVPTLVTNETQLLDRYTAEGKIKVGDDLSFFSAKAFLQTSNKLWVVRATDGSQTFGNIEIMKAGSLLTSAPKGIVPAVTESVTVTFAPITAGQTFTVGGLTYTAHATTETTTAADLATAIIAGVANPAVGTGAMTVADAPTVAAWVRSAVSGHTNQVLFTSATTSQNVTNLAASTGTGASGAVVGTTTEGSNGGSATGIADPEVTAYTFNADGLCVLYAVNEGVWNNSLSVAVTTADAKAPAGTHPFVIRVYNSGSLVETFTVSAINGEKDGYNRALFLETVLLQSNYIRGQVNPALAEVVAGTALPKVNGTAISLGGGTDGSTPDSGDFIAAYDALKGDLYPVTFLLDGGQAVQAVQNAILAQCIAKEDRFAILSFPYVTESSSDYEADLLAWKDGLTPTMYGAIYSSYLKIYDAENDRPLTVPPDGYVGALFAEVANKFAPYSPVSGFTKGNLSALGVNGLYRHFTEGERDNLVDAGINPIRFKSGRGIHLWGQETLYGDPSALSKINVAMLLVVIRPAIKDYLEELMFDINDFTNDNGVRHIVKTRLSTYLSTHVPDGIYEYRVVCDDTNNSQDDVDANRLNVWVYIKPAKDIEDIRFKTVITPTSVSFDLAISNTTNQSIA